VALADAVLFGETDPEGPLGESVPDFYDLGVGQLGGVMMLATGSEMVRTDWPTLRMLLKPLPTLANHVTAVVPPRSKKQVLGPPARRVVALMQHAKTWGDLASVQPPGDPVGQLDLPISNVDPPVAVRIAKPGPLPAAIFGRHRIVQELRRQNARVHR